MGLLMAALFEKQRRFRQDYHADCFGLFKRSMDFEQVNKYVIITQLALYARFMHIFNYY